MSAPPCIYCGSQDTTDYGLDDDENIPPGKRIYHVECNTCRRGFPWEQGDNDQPEPSNDGSTP